MHQRQIVFPPPPSNFTKLYERKLHINGNYLVIHPSAKLEINVAYRLFFYLQKENQFTRGAFKNKFIHARERMAIICTQIGEWRKKIS